MTTTTTQAVSSDANDKAKPPSTNSTPTLDAFLAQISAGSSSTTLPLHAQASLVATQLSNVEDAAVKLLSSHKDDVVGTISGAEEAQSRLLDLDTRVEQISQQVSVAGGKSSLDTSTLLTSLQAYLDAYNAYHQKSLLLKTLTTLQPLLQAVEDLEDHVRSGPIDCKVLTGKVVAAESLLAAFSPTGEHAWLRQGNAKASSDLEERIGEAKRESDDILERAWSQAIRLSKEAGSDVSWSISLESQVQVGTSNRSAALADIATSLEAKGRLKSKLESVGVALGDLVPASILSADVASVDFSVEAGTARVAGSRSGEENPRSSLNHFTQLVGYLDSHLLQHISSHKATFSQRFLAPTIPLLLSKLRQCLPSKWSHGAQRLSDELQSIAGISRNIYTTLVEHGLIPADLQAESQQDELLGSPSRLLDFAQRVGEVYGKQVENSIRDQTRRLLLASVDGQTAWDTEEIEVEPTVILPDEDGKYEESAVEAMLGNNNHSQPQNVDGWGWGAEDDENDSQPQPNAILTSAAAAKAKGRAALGGVRVIRPQDQLGSGPFPQGEGAEDAWGFDDDDDDDGGWSTSNPSAASQRPATVVPAKPEPVADAWGFEDEDEGLKQESTTPASLPASKTSVAPPAEQTRHEEDDAWFQEEDTLGGRSSEQQQTAARQPPSHTLPAAFIPADDTEADAWFVDEAPKDVKGSETVPAHSLDTDIQTSAPALAPAIPVQSTGILAESSLDAVEGAPTTPPQPTVPVQASSVHSTPSQVSDTSFSRTTRDFDLSYDDDDDDEEDAWGLSEEEKTQKVLNKRASRMLGGLVPAQGDASTGLQASASADTISSLTPTPSQTDVTASATEDEDTSLTPSSSLAAVPTQGEALDGTTPQLGTNAATFSADDDDDDDAWGLSAEEQEARSKRRSQLFGAPPPQFLATLNNHTRREAEPISELSEEPSGETASTGREQLTEKNLEAAAAEREQNHTASNGEGAAHPESAHRPLLPPSIRLPPPSEVSSVSALPPSSPTSDRLTFEEQNESHLAPGNLAETSSVISETSSEVAFPIESALPDDLQPSEVASDASLPATPTSERAAETMLSLDGSTTQSVAELIRQQEADMATIDDADDETADIRSIAHSLPLSDGGDVGSPAAAREMFPLQSALPLSSAGPDTPNETASSVAGGPPSVASLPPTPKAERHVELPSGDELVGSSDSGSQAAIPPSAPVSRPYTPDVSIFATPDVGSDPPFPIHSAVPYSAGTGRTGPPSIAGSVADSDVALPPSPYPERISTPLTDGGDDEGDDLFNSDDYPHGGDGGGAVPDILTGAATETRDRSATATLSSVNAENLRRLSATPQPPDVASHVDEQQRLADVGQVTTDVNGVDDEDDDDPWDDFEAQPKEVAPREALPIQPALENVDPIAAQRTAGTLQSTVEPEIESNTAGNNLNAEPNDDDDEDEDGWKWGDEEGEGPVPTQQPVLQPAVPSPPSVAKRALSPLSGQRRAASPSGASPQLRQATLKRAVAAGAAGAAALAGGAVVSNAVRDGAAASREVPSAAKQQEAHPVTVAAAPPAARRMEKSKISKRSRELVELAHRVIDDAIQLAKERDEGNASILPSPANLLKPIVDIFELHRALMPALHRDVLLNVPSLAVQFANDCQFLSKEMLLIAGRLEDNSAALGAYTSEIPTNLRTEAQRTTLLGQRIFEGQMTIQASLLNEHLVQTDSLLRVYEDGRFENVQRIHTQVVHLISSLYSAWHSVLNESAVRASVGTLIEATLQRVWKWVLDLDDIGEIEGQRLAELVKVFTKLEQLYATGTDDKSNIALFVPSWIKVTGYLPEILLGSLADVEFLLFEAGGLDAGESSEAVGKEEAKRLIRSTFADTTRRRELLARVERA